MQAKKIRTIWKILKRPLTIVIVPHLSLFRTRKCELTLSFIIAMLGLWTLVTLWAGYSVGVNIDYNVTKANNKLLKTKFALVAKKINISRQYLEMTRQAHEKVRELLKMDKETITRSEGIGGATFDENITFRKVLSKKASQISERIFSSNIDYITGESKKSLTSFQDIAWYITNEQNIYKATPSIWPTSGRLTSHYGYRIITIGGATKGDLHPGVDIASDPDTPIYATADGVVRNAGYVRAGLGNTILIDHGFGFSTLYGHTTAIKVKPGQSVKRGQLIALMGTTGRSTGTHLHYEIWRYGESVNPMKYLKVGKLKRKKEDLKNKLSELF